jgi:Zn-dependent protease
MRIAGIPITVDYSWFIVALLVVWSLSAGYFPRRYAGESTEAYWVAGIITTLLFFASILAHELSHSLVAIRSGIKIPGITLFIFGGVSRLSEDAKTPATEFKIAVVGPLSSFLLAAAFYLVAQGLSGRQPPLTVAVFQYLAFINLALGVFNLVPGFPLDGGRVLRAFWWWKTGSLTRATKVASDWGKGFALTLILVGGLQIFAGNLLGGIWFIFIGMFLRGAAAAGYEDLVMRRSLEGVQVQEVMVRDVVTVPPDLSLSRLVDDYFLKSGYRGYPVVESGRTLGVVSLANVSPVLERDRARVTVREVMVPLGEASVIAPEAPLDEALRKMTARGLGRLLVVKDDRLAGMITKTGLVRLLEMRRILAE